MLFFQIKVIIAQYCKNSVHIAQDSTVCIMWGSTRGLHISPTIIQIALPRLVLLSSLEDIDGVDTLTDLFE